MLYLVLTATQANVDLQGAVDFMSKWPTLTDRASRIVLNSGQGPTQLDKNFASVVHRAPLLLSATTRI